MATMNISLPDTLKSFIDARVTNDGYGNVSEYVRDTTDWKQITREFQTGDVTTIQLGCRLDNPQTSDGGTAWFDDLVLEKVE